MKNADCAEWAECANLADNFYLGEGEGWVLIGSLMTLYEGATLLRESQRGEGQKVEETIFVSAA